MELIQWSNPGLSSEEMEQLSELLEELRADPMPLHQQDPLALANHPLISEMQAVNIGYYISRNGRVIDWYELTNIRGIDPDWIQRVKPFLCLKCEARTGSELTRARVVLSYFRESMDESSSSDGLKHKEDGLVSVNHGQWTGRLRWQTDRGEVRPTEWYAWADHIAGYLTYQSNGHVLSVGSHLPSAGKGILLGNRGMGMAVNSRGEWSTPSRNTHTAAGGLESRYFNGIAYQHQARRWTISAFTGNNRWDGLLNRGQLALSSTGIHRTESERNRRRQVNVATSVLSIEHQSNSHRLTLSGVTTRASAGQIVEQRSGLSLSALWMKADYRWDGEIGLDNEGKWAGFISLQSEWIDYRWGLRFHAAQVEYSPSYSSTTNPFTSHPGASSLESFIGTQRGDWNGSCSMALVRKPNEVNGSRISTRTEIRLNGNYDDLLLEGRFRLRGEENQLEQGSGTLLTTYAMDSTRIRLRTDISLTPGEPAGWSNAIEWTQNKGIHQWGLRYIYVRTNSENPIRQMSWTTSLNMRIHGFFRNAQVLEARYQLSWKWGWKFQLTYHWLYQAPTSAENDGATTSSIRHRLYMELHWRFN